MKKLLIVYYTWSNGNTARIAKETAKRCGRRAFCKSTPPYRMQEVTMMW